MALLCGAMDDGGGGSALPNWTCSSARSHRAAPDESSSSYFLRDSGGDAGCSDADFGVNGDAVAHQPLSPART